MRSPLSPTAIRIEKVDIRLAGNVTGGRPENYEIDVKTGSRKKKDALSYRVSLDLTLNPMEGCACRYERIEVRASGLFDLPADAPLDLVQKIVPLNCWAILHGFLRGIVAQLTGLNPGGPVILPAVNFVQVAKDHKKAASRRQ